MRKIAIVCNPLPENEKTIKVADAITRILKTKAISFSIFTTYWPQVWDDYTDAWIVGGDGTLNYFINQYPDIALPLSIFKGGSGNDFHWTLFGEITLEQQVEKAINGSVQMIDAGICNGRLFINGIGIGFDGSIVKDLLGRKKQSGKSSYLLSILKNILGYKEKVCSLLLNDRNMKQPCFMISVANGKRYGGGYRVAPKAVLSDSLLDVNIVGRLAPFKRLFYLPVIEKGNHLKLPFVQYIQTGKVIIKSNGLLPAHADGEFFEAGSFEIECLPKRFSFRF